MTAKKTSSKIAEKTEKKIKDVTKIKKARKGSSNRELINKMDNDILLSNNLNFKVLEE